MSRFVEQMKQAARQNPKRVLFAEGNEARIVEAAAQIEAEGLAQVQRLTELDPEKLGEYTKQYAEIRNCDLEEASEAVQNPNCYATLALLNDEADVLITGPSSPSKERILPALKLVDTVEPDAKASSSFVMVLPDDTDEDAANGGLLVFADCAININPDSKTLAQIAKDSASTAKALGLEPIVALLSFSTEGSSDAPNLEKIREAKALLEKSDPELKVLGEVQADAALMDEIGKRKTHGNPLAGHANVLIFPDLEAGNIAYKLVERLAGAKAIGPIVQGLQKHVNELSRGASVEDIVNLAAVSSVMASS